MASDAIQGRVLITGGAGFLGSALACRLHDQGREVLLLDNLVRNSLPHLEHPAAAGLALHQADITDEAALRQALQGVAVVVHMAAIAGPRNYYERPHEVMQVNLGGTLTLLRALAGSEVQKLVFLSSSEVYGARARDAREDQATEVAAYPDMRWTYALSKLAGEKACLAYGEQHGLPVISLRPFNVFGPGQTGEGAVRDMIRAAQSGAPVVIHGDGEQVRAWCYVNDFIDALLAALERTEPAGEVFNVGNPDSAVSVKTLAEQVIATVGQGRIQSEPHFGTDIAFRTPNIERARERLGFRPRVSLAEGLAEAARWYAAHDA